MKIGILQTGYAPDAMIADGDYPDMFMELLAERGFEFETYPVLDMVFPSDVHACDGWLITGSKHGVYEDHPFIAPLEDFVREIFAQGLPIAGICFGHQIMAQALGGKVEKFSGGWSIGPTEYDFGGTTMRLNAWHQDQVTELPKGATVIGASDFCQYAALAYGDQGYSVQPHPEFADPFVRRLIDERGRGVVPDAILDAARDKLGAPLHSVQIADTIADLFHNAARKSSAA